MSSSFSKLRNTICPQRFDEGMKSTVGFKFLLDVGHIHCHSWNIVEFSHKIYKKVSFGQQSGILYPHDIHTASITILMYYEYHYLCLLLKEIKITLF